jgi:ubiquinone/menaquinone biosynthesis C-methylase UbiE
MNSGNQAVQSIQFDKVADLYDYYVKVDFDVNFFLQEAKRAGGKVLELTCGTGRVSIPLVQAGVELTCVDYSDGMLAVLREKLDKYRLSCRVFNMDITELSLQDRFDLIFIPFHSFSEILDESKHKQTLERICAHLTERGRFICTLQNTKARIRSMDGALKLLGKFPTDSGGSLVVPSLLSYDASAQIVHGFQVYEIYNDQNALIDKRTLEMNFYLFAKTEFEELIHSTGFQVEELYGDYAYSEFDEDASPFMIWKLKNTQTA